MCRVYIVVCRDGTLYTGWTNDLGARIKAHNNGQGGKYTRSRLPVSLIYSEKHATRSDAMKRECAIKKMSRDQKLRLVGQTDEER
jgi:putative endonuclease